jgi:hypothetical protein
MIRKQFRPDRKSAGPAAPPARIQSSISGCEFMAQTPIRILVI